jgi:hypothetical protein
MRVAPILLTMTGLVFVAASLPAHAGINQRQKQQQHRIYSGIQNGSLTNREAYQLERQQLAIARYEAQSRADGPGLTRYERSRLHHMQDTASRTLYRQKHDTHSR